MQQDHQPKTKEVDGKEYPASEFAYVPDPEKPSTWKLPIFDAHHVGGALEIREMRGRRIYQERYPALKKQGPP